jgi:hypothetical protein
MPTAEEVADRLGLSQERRKYLSELAESARTSVRAKTKTNRTAMKKAPTRKAA